MESMKILIEKNDKIYDAFNGIGWVGWVAPAGPGEVINFTRSNSE